MPALLTDDAYIAQVGANKTSNKNFSLEIGATSTTVITGQLHPIQNLGVIATMESLPSGVTSFKLVGGRLRASTTGLYVVAKMVDMGSLNIATPTFTDGSAMPTLTEGNASHATSSTVLMEVTTALNATPGSMTATYVDQDGNTAETTTSTVLTASAIAQSVGQLVLNGSDSGAQDITTATRTSGTTPSGVIKFWGVQSFACLNIQAIQQFDYFNLSTSDIPPIDLGAGDNLYLLHIGTATAKAVFGDLQFIGNT